MNTIKFCIVVDEGKTYSQAHRSEYFFKKFDLSEEDRKYFKKNKNKVLSIEEGEICEELYSNHDRENDIAQIIIKNLHTNELATIGTAGVQNFHTYQEVIKHVFRYLK